MARKCAVPTTGVQQSKSLGWAAANMFRLEQVKTEEKSNEITVVPQLLEMLELGGCL